MKLKLTYIHKFCLHGPNIPAFRVEINFQGAGKFVKKFWNKNIKRFIP